MSNPITYPAYPRTELGLAAARLAAARSGGHVVTIDGYHDAPRPPDAPAAGYVVVSAAAQRRAAAAAEKASRAASRAILAHRLQAYSPTH